MRIWEGGGEKKEFGWQWGEHMQRPGCVLGEVKAVQYAQAWGGNREVTEGKRRDERKLEIPEGWGQL